jgi:hypothetical protein
MLMGGWRARRGELLVSGASGTPGRPEFVRTVEHRAH